MTIAIRPLSPADYEAVTALKNQVRHAPGTAAEKARFIEGWKADNPAVHLVAELGGQVAGYALAYQASWIKPDTMFAHVVTDRACRGQGVGSALLAALDPFIAEHKPAWLSTEARDDDEPALTWAERRGFERRHHFFDSELDLSSFDPAPFAERLEQVKAQGVRFLPFSELQSPESERELYDFFHKLLFQTPNGADTAQGTFEDWRAFLLGEPHGWPQAVILAVDQAGRWLGLTALKRFDKTAHIAFTGVEADARGRGIALAMKLVCGELARAQGIEKITTVNHAANGPMLAINRKLGYVPLPGHFFLYKRVGGQV